MKFYLKTIIEASSEEAATALRDQMVGAVEDYREGGYPGEATVGPLIEIETKRGEAIKKLARERHCYGSDDEIEVDDEHVIVSEGEHGAFVAAWVWVPYPEAKPATAAADAAVMADSEGGHCD